MSAQEPDELDPAAISAAYERRIAAIAPEHVAGAMRLLARLDPKRWRLEWHLPLWLGNALGLDRQVSTEIAVSNVLGLASLRLRDDLVDDDVDGGDVAGAPALVATLFEASIDAYRSRFPPASGFWMRLDRWMAEWQAATLDNGHPGGGDGPPPGLALPGTSLERLSRRGAPLKISAYAVCRLTKRTVAFPTTERSLDHALAAMVLYDHVCDWEADLAGGRWNAFVAATGTSQRPEDRRRARAGVLAAMMAGNVIATTFARVQLELDEAVVACNAIGVPALSAHLADLAGRLDREGKLLGTHYSAHGERAVALVFGDQGLAERDASRESRVS